MDNGKTIAADIVAASDLIDDIEALALGVVGKADKIFLAAYQAKLAAARTKLTDDWRFINLFTRVWLNLMAKK